MIKKPEGKAHHGDLREVLVLAGLVILEEEWLSGLTLRKCAARAGVNHAAPAHYSSGLGALKSAIATRAYATFERCRPLSDDQIPRPVQRQKRLLFGGLDADEPHCRTGGSLADRLGVDGVRFTPA